MYDKKLLRRKELLTEILAFRLSDGKNSLPQDYGLSVNCHAVYKNDTKDFRCKNDPNILVDESHLLKAHACDFWIDLQWVS